MNAPAPDYAAQLAEARDALHQLRMGQTEVKIEYGDHSVTYQKADRADLERYVAELEALCAGKTAASTRKGPLKL